MRYVVDRNVVMRHMTVLSYHLLISYLHLFISCVISQKKECPLQHNAHHINVLMLGTVT